MRTSKRMPGTGRRSDRTAIHRRICGRATAPPPDDAKSGQKKETFPRSALSTSVGPITRRPTATPARAGDPLTLLITRHAGTAAGAAGKNASPSRRHRRSTQSGRPSSSRSGTRDTPRRCCRSGHTRQDSRCSQGRGARQAHDELGKLPEKTDGRAAMDAPPEQEGRPPLHQATGG